MVGGDHHFEIPGVIDDVADQTVDFPDVPAGLFRSGRMGVGHIIGGRDVEKIGTVLSKDFTRRPQKPVVHLDRVDPRRRADPSDEPLRRPLRRLGKGRPVPDQTLQFVLGGQQAGLHAPVGQVAKGGPCQQILRRFHVALPAGDGVQQVVGRDPVGLRKAGRDDGGVVDIGHRGDDGFADAVKPLARDHVQSRRFAIRQVLRRAAVEADDHPGLHGFLLWMSRSMSIRSFRESITGISVRTEGQLRCRVRCFSQTEFIPAASEPQTSIRQSSPT